MEITTEKTKKMSTNWNIVDEIRLLRWVSEFKPAGVHKHFQMMCIVERLNHPDKYPLVLLQKENRRPNKQFTVDTVWAKLAQYYNLEEADKIENRNNTEINNEANGKSIEENGTTEDQHQLNQLLQHTRDFALPWNEYGELILSNAKKGASDDDETDNQRNIKVTEVKVTAKNDKKPENGTHEETKEIVTEKTVATVVPHESPKEKESSTIAKEIIEKVPSVEAPIETIIKEVKDNDKNVSSPQMEDKEIKIPTDTPVEIMVETQPIGETVSAAEEVNEEKKSYLQPVKVPIETEETPDKDKDTEERENEEIRTIEDAKTKKKDINKQEQTVAEKRQTRSSSTIRVSSRLREKVMKGTSSDEDEDEDEDGKEEKKITETKTDSVDNKNVIDTTTTTKDNTEEPNSEEPNSEEPKSEEPKSEEPKSEEPKSEEDEEGGTSEDEDEDEEDTGENSTSTKKSTKKRKSAISDEPMAKRTRHSSSARQPMNEESHEETSPKKAKRKDSSTTDAPEKPLRVSRRLRSRK